MLGIPSRRKVTGVLRVVNICGSEKSPPLNIFLNQ
jgi:hypothetical protein